VLAIDAGSGALLGLAGMQIWTRQGPASPDYRQQPIEEKESYRWIKGAASAKSELAAAVMVTVIGDRESDIYEEFDRIPDARTHLLTRAVAIAHWVGGGRLFGITESWPVRHRTSWRSSPARRPARTAKVALRFGEVTIKRPGNCSDPAAPPQLVLRLVEVRELDPAVSMRRSIGVYSLRMRLRRSRRPCRSSAGIASAGTSTVVPHQQEPVPSLIIRSLFTRATLPVASQSLHLRLTPLPVPLGLSDTGYFTSMVATRTRYYHLRSATLTGRSVEQFSLKVRRTSSATLEPGKSAPALLPTPRQRRPRQLRTAPGHEPRRSPTP